MADVEGAFRVAQKAFDQVLTEARNERDEQEARHVAEREELRATIRETRRENDELKENIKRLNGLLARATAIVESDALAIEAQKEAITEYEARIAELETRIKELTPAEDAETSE